MSPVPLECTQAPTPTASATVEAKRLIHDNDALDEALVESFPASDPVAVSFTRIEVGSCAREVPLKTDNGSSRS